MLIWIKLQLLFLWWDGWNWAFSLAALSPQSYQYCSSAAMIIWDLWDRLQAFYYWTTFTYVKKGRTKMLFPMTWLASLLAILFVEICQLALRVHDVFRNVFGFGRVRRVRFIVFCGWRIFIDLLPEICSCSCLLYSIKIFNLVITLY